MYNVAAYRNLRLIPQFSLLFNSIVTYLLCR